MLSAPNTPHPAAFTQTGACLQRELLRTFLVDSGKKVERSDVIDVGHAVVPVAYCDYVLLDSHWRTQVEIAKRRIAAAGMTFPMAKVFSAPGIEDFLRELES